MEVFYPKSFGMDKIFCFVDFHLGVPPKNSRYLVIWPKNDAKEQEKEKEKEKKKKKKKKKENVGIFSVNSSFFSARKKRNHHENLPFYLIRYGSSRDSSSPYETKNLIFAREGATCEGALKIGRPDKNA